MKLFKKFVFLIFAVFVISIVTNVTAYATETEQDKQSEEDVFVGVNFYVTFKNAQTGGDVFIWLQNKTTEQFYSVSLPDANGNTIFSLLPLGDYTMINSEIRSTNGYIDNDCEVILNDFTLDLSKLDWEIEIIAKLKPYDADRTTKEEEVEVTPSEPVATDVNRIIEELPQYLKDIFSEKIEEDNKYFPNMTVYEIQMWYVENISEFINNNKIDKDLDFFTEKLAEWAEWVGNGKEDKWLNPLFNVCVKPYNKNDTVTLYEIQKKIFDFIKDYYDETGKSLDFSNWNYDEIFMFSNITPEVLDILKNGADEAPTSEPIVITPVEVQPVVTVTSTPVPTVEPAKETIVTEEPTPSPAPAENKFLSILKSAWFTILLLVVIAVVGIVIKIKYKKKNL